MKVKMKGMSASEVVRLTDKTGLNVSHLAKEMGVPRRTVQRWRKAGVYKISACFVREFVERYMKAKLGDKT